jgi:hypothetical protein
MPVHCRADKAGLVSPRGEVEVIQELPVELEALLAILSNFAQTIAVESHIEYKRPPVVERVATIYAEIPEEIFESRFEAWRNQVEAQYPIYEPLKQWDLMYAQKGDPTDPIPVLTSTTPQLRITPRFSRRLSKEGFDWSIRCPRDQFTMNVHPDPEDGSGRRYTQLRYEYLNWAEKWMKHFDVKSIGLIQLNYVNVLNKTTVPSFFSPDGQSFSLPQLINIFTNLSRPGEVMMPPFACQATVGFTNKKNATLSVQVQDATTSPLDVGVLVGFIATMQPEEPEPSIQKIAELLDWAHERILERFDMVFSDRAKESFEPVTK